MNTKALAVCIALFAVVLVASVWAQEAPPRRPPQVVSPEVTAERNVTFRILAPEAESVRLVSSDLPRDIGSLDLEKGDNGVWQTTVGPVPPGAYRYHFQIVGVAVVDPRNPATSESNANVWSLVYVPGSEISDVTDVPHGAVAEVTYYSKTLERFRRMHVYTPPGYAKGEGTFPVLYLLHGASDSDASWSTVGRAGQILDNLIAAGKAKPMIVVMPAGHTGSFRFGGGGGFNRQMDEFVEDFINDLRPHVEKHYRVAEGRQNRAIAGLSMGGAQSLNVAFKQLGDFAYLGVFSSGIFGIAGGRDGSPPNRQWEEANRAALEDAKLKEGLKLVWLATGKEDFLLSTTQATVKMLQEHDFEVKYEETEGGHTWRVWRDYLAQFATQLF